MLVWISCGWTSKTKTLVFFFLFLGSLTDNVITHFNHGCLRTKIRILFFTVFVDVTPCLKFFLLSFPPLPSDFLPPSKPSSKHIPTCFLCYAFCILTAEVALTLICTCEYNKSFIQKVFIWGYYVPSTVMGSRSVKYLPEAGKSGSTELRPIIKVFFCYSMCLCLMSKIKIHIRGDKVILCSYVY